MSKFVEDLDEETIKAGENFIDEIKMGLYYKRILPNTSDEYPLDEAVKSFKHFITTNESESISKVKPE